MKNRSATRGSLCAHDSEKECYTFLVAILERRVQFPYLLAQYFFFLVYACVCVCLSALARSRLSLPILGVITLDNEKGCLSKNRWCITGRRKQDSGICIADEELNNLAVLARWHFTTKIYLAHRNYGCKNDKINTSVMSI